MACLLILLTAVAACLFTVRGDTGHRYPIPGTQWCCDLASTEARTQINSVIIAQTFIYRWQKLMREEKCRDVKPDAADELWWPEEPPTDKEEALAQVITWVILNLPRLIDPLMCPVFEHQSAVSSKPVVKTILETYYAEGGCPDDHIFCCANLIRFVPPWGGDALCVDQATYDAMVAASG